MGETDLQLGGGYIYQWECAVLLALNYFFEPMPYNPTLFDLVEGFLGQVAEIHLEGEDRERGIDLEDITLVNGDRRILVQVKTKQAEGERWTPSDRLLLKALYRFYDSRFFAEQPADTRFVFLTNRPFNPDLARAKSAIHEGTVVQCSEADKLRQHLARYAREKKGASIEAGRFREMLARTVLVEYLALDTVKANVLNRLEALGWGDCEQARTCLFDHFSHLSTRTGGGTVTRASLIEVLGSPESETLDDYLARAVATYEARMYQLVARSTALPDQPYKFLYAFEIEDAGIFFGRDGASEDFCQTVLKDRLTVLHAKSGAGKTSLLNAGLSPRLIREGRLPVYARAYEDPVRAVKRAIVPASSGPGPELLPELTLHEFLGLACGHLSRQTQELVVILDQFEEFFVFRPEPDHRQPFIDALADCYDDRPLPVRFVIALRKDYYSDLADFQGRIPTILYNEYRLDTMTREEAQAAITSPVAKLDQPVAYDQALLDTLLDDLARSGMELPHLQIICTRLYEDLAESKATITLASYEKLGRAEGVLGGYLNDVLDRLPGRGGVIAREVLKELVSSEATKRVLIYDTLAARVEARRDELDGVLARLVDARLLRRDEVAGEVTYEMAHEYLIEEIRQWIDQADLAFKQAEELLAREVASWRVHGTLIPRDRLEVLYTQRERFRGLTEEACECLLRSALQADFATADWASLAGEVSRRLLLAMLNDTRANMRQRAADLLGQLGNSCDVDPLIVTLRDKDSDVCRAAMRGLGLIWEFEEVFMLGHEDGDMRQAAARTLGELGDTRAVEPLIAALRDEDGDVRRMAAGALRELSDTRAVEPLIAALRDEDGDVRQAATRTLGELGDTRAVEPLIAALRDENSLLRRSAAKALGEIGDPRAVEPLIAALCDVDISLHRSIIQSLGAIWGLPEVSGLGDEDGDMRQAAARTLGELGDTRAVEPLIAALRDENSLLRQSAAEALGEIGDPRAVEPLIAALRDEDGDVRWMAAGALRELGDTRAVEPLIAALRDENSLLRRSAAEALGTIGDPCAVEPLIAALWDEDGDVRRAATRALVELDESAVDPLIAALRSRGGFVREGAAEALGRIGEPRAVESLVGALSDLNSDVRKMVAWALGKIGDPHGVKPLISTLCDSNHGVREVAAGALGEIGDPHAVEPLIAMVWNRSSDWRSTLWTLLRRRRGPWALRDEPSAVREAAAEALRKIGTPEALAALEEWQRQQA